jgi:FPC/CPF motif-containing protein YcgG
MIDKAMEAIRDELNAHYRHRYGLDEDMAIIANLISPEGKIADGEANKVVITLINIEHETSVSNKRTMVQDGDSYVKYNSPVSVNFYIVCAAHFKESNYVEAVKFISSVILFFQGKHLFTHQNTTGLDRSIEKLSLEIVNQDLQHLSSFWSFIGTRYMPSVIFKVRAVTFDDNTVMEIRKAATNPALETKG